MVKQATKTVIVKGKVADIHQVWANFENLSYFMKHIKSVTCTGEATSHWTMKGSRETTLTWNVRLTAREENQRLIWQSTDGDLQAGGQVIFTALPQHQTALTVTLHYAPPPDLPSEVMTELFGNLDNRLMEDLRSFKAYVEHKSDRLLNEMNDKSYEGADLIQKSAFSQKG